MEFNDGGNRRPDCLWGGLLHELERLQSTQKSVRRPADEIVWELGKTRQTPCRTATQCQLSRNRSPQRAGERFVASGEDFGWPLDNHPRLIVKRCLVGRSLGAHRERHQNHARLKNPDRGGSASPRRALRWQVGTEGPRTLGQWPSDDRAVQAEKNRLRLSLHPSNRRGLQLTLELHRGRARKPPQTAPSIHSSRSPQGVNDGLLRGGIRPIAGWSFRHLSVQSEPSVGSDLPLRAEDSNPMSLSSPDLPARRSRLLIGPRV